MPIKAKILIVEDEAPVAMLFRFNLEKEGYEVKVAVNGNEGLEMATSNNFDLILSDIMMPVMDGYEFRRNLLQQKKLKNTPFVFLTAKGEESDILSGYDLGIDEYIIKTSPPKIVLAKIKAILSSRDKGQKEAVDELNQAIDSLGSRVVPNEVPTLPNFEIKHWHKPFKDIPGGDFIDYIEVDDDNLFVVLGDVMGKKWNAWYFALAYAGYIRGSVRVVVESFKDYSPAKILEQVNKTVFNDERISEVFTTISILILNKNHNTILYSGAGDLPILLQKNNNEFIQEISSQGLLLGFSETSEYSNIEIKLEKKDTIYLLTDGIIEAENNESELLGLDRFKDILLKNPDTDNPMKHIKSQLNNFTKSDFSDDLSLITITQRN